MTRSLDTSLFFTKNDPLDPRLGERAIFESTPSQIPHQNVIIAGAPDDEGISLNGGRPGSKDAPTEIRRIFYKMTPPADGSFPDSLFDLGDPQTSSGIWDRHLAHEQLLFDAHLQNHTCISLGGGHDYGYPDGSAFIRAYQSQSPWIVNFDAHLDVRPMVSTPHSGTPFYRLLKTYPSQFSFFEVGLQPQCNSKFHADWALQNGATKLIWETELALGPNAHLKPYLAQAKPPCWISLDIDCFSNKEAPGCSQSWASGFLYDSFVPWLTFLVQHCSVKGLGIYEVSPRLDQDNRTSKLAALIMYRFLQELSKPQEHALQP